MNLNNNGRQRSPARRDREGARRGWQTHWAALLAAPRTAVLALVILAVFVAFSRRLWYMQFVKGEDYQKRASRQSTLRVDVPAPRGIIYDREGKPVVRNVPSFYITVVPADLPEDEDEAENVLVRLAVLLDMPYRAPEAEEDEDEPARGLRDVLHDALLDGDGNELPFDTYYHPVVVKRGVERDKALLVAQEVATMPGVSVGTESVREYLYGPLLSQVLGYLLPVPDEEEYRKQGYDASTDRIGVVGVEWSFEDALRGEKGERIVEKDVLGQVIRVVEEKAAPVAGDNVHLTIDVDLQQFVEQMLEQGLANANSPRGVAIVMNPQTGEILAMVSLPTYDNNIFVQGVTEQDLERWNDPHRPLVNHAISDGLPPGSVFKVVVATAALEEGVLTPRTRLNCPGKIVVPNKYAPNEPSLAQPFYCWNRAGHGTLDIVGGVAHSCDIFFYKVGGGFEETDFEGLGVDLIAEYARMFGLGEPTGVKLPGEIGGLVPTADWKRQAEGESWSTGDTYNLSIGQGYLSVTPLQMLNAVNVVANGGVLYRPTVVHHVTDAQEEVIEPFEAEIARTLPISKEHLSLVREGMEGAVAYGTAFKRGQVEDLRIAGKTGTAQYCDDIALEQGTCGVGYEQPEHAWYAAFAPMEQPEISVIVFIYSGGEGSVTAVPVARDILAHYFGLDEEVGEGQ